MDDMIIEIHEEFVKVCNECRKNNSSCSQDCRFYKLSDLFNDFFVEYFQSMYEE